MQRRRNVIFLFLLLLVALAFLFWNIFGRRRHEPVMPPAPVVTPPSPVPIAPSKPTLPRPALPTPGANLPTPPKIELHKELIPKNIEIVRCYYAQEIAPPGTTFGFDINGSGFNAEFEKMIKVDVENSDIRIKNLQLVTANQIHGDMQVGSNARTDFVYPRVLIKKLPVFGAPEPFAVVRKGDVLTIIFISMEESGRAGRFRVITNLDEDLFKQFQVLPSTPGLQVSDIAPHLPYAIEGTLRIRQGVPTGDYGLVVRIGPREAFRRNGMIRIVRPNVGQSGFVQGLLAAETYHRPGDAIQIYVQGSGLSPQDVNDLNARVDGFDMGRGSFTYLSGAQLRVSFESPPDAPAGPYGVTVLHVNGQTLYQKKDVFKIIPPDWVAGVQVSPPARPGQKSLLRVLGRDLSPDFARNLQIDVDEPAITISGLHQVDPGTLAADIVVSSSVAAGDYWLHLSSHGKKIDPPYGSIIKVESPL